MCNMFRCFMLPILHNFFAEQSIPQTDGECNSSRCIETAKMYRQNMNADTEACNNFYEYACRKYANSVSIPAHEEFISPFLTRVQEVDNTIIDYIEENINADAPRSFQKIRTFYKSCLNKEQIRAKGYESIQNELNIIGMDLVPPFHSRTQSKKSNHAQLLGKIHRFLIPTPGFLFNVDVRPNPLDMNLNIIFVGTGSELKDAASDSVNECHDGIIQGPFDDDYPLGKYMFKVIAHLYEHLRIKLTKEVNEEIEQGVNDITNFLVELFQIRQKLETSPRGIDMFCPREVKELMNQLLKGGEIQIDFIEYAKALFSSIEDTRQYFKGSQDSKIIMISIVDEFREIFKLLQRTSSSTFESVMWWISIHSILEDGPKPLDQYYEDYLQQFSDQRSNPPRSLHCIGKIKTHFGLFVGYLLAKRSGVEKKRKEEQVNEMFENIKYSFEKSIKKARWLDDYTRRTALKKIKNMTAYIGFPDSMVDLETVEKEYGKTHIQPENYLTSLANLRRLQRALELSKLYSCNNFDDKEDGNPSNVGANYILCYNHITVPIARLGFPLYDLGLEVLNYAALGSVIAHEMGHALDRLGSQINEEGNIREWWSKSSTKAYDKIVECFIKSYNNIYIEAAKLSVNGKFTINENMADWQGFKISLMAYRKYVKDHGGEPKLVDFQDLNPQKLFALAFANIHCTNARTSFLIEQIETDPHAPNEARVNGVLKNSREFSAAWNCKNSAPMNPKKKCTIWN